MNVSTPSYTGRPPREHWQFLNLSDTSERQARHDFQKDKPLTSAELAQHPELIPEDGLTADYVFQRDCGRMNGYSAKDFVRPSLIGAAAGAAVGVVGVGALNMVGDLLHAVGPQVFSSAALGLGAAAAVCGGVGALIGASSAWSELSQYPQYGESCLGTLQAPYGPDGKQSVVFRPYGQEGTKVDLAAFAQAPVIAGGEPGENPGTNWWQSSHPAVEY